MTDEETSAKEEALFLDVHAMLERHGARDADGLTDWILTRVAAHDAEVREAALEEAAATLDERATKYAETADRLAREREWEDSTRYSHYAIAHGSDAFAIRALAAPVAPETEE